MPGVKRSAAARASTRSAGKRPTPAINDLWYKNAVIYCLSVGTFMDANGDGIGDFAGLMRRLDYLHGLGITAIWLMPFQSSPGRDDGYDISDYYGVNPAHGTLGDFVEFTHAAKQRGIRVIIDLVVNHTSDQHHWFQEARRDPKSRYRDWYVWSDKKPPNANTGMVFPGVQKSTWTYDKEARAWYFHRFYDFQPDLNTSNPNVQAEILKIMGFWIQLGVSGFRMDAVPFVISTKGPRVRKPVEQYEMLRSLRAFLQWRVGDSIILAEANVLPETDMEYFGEDGDRMHMMFNFQVNQNLFYALASSDSRPLARALKATMHRPETAQWGLFLRNHDELDLGRLSEEQRREVFKCFGPEQSMQLYERGIRRRLAPMLSGDRRLIELAYSLMFTLPGTPVLRYGDEIGMGDDLDLPERNCARTPMQWSTEPHGGFTKADKPVVPVISEGPYGYPHVNAAEQRREPNSMLNWTERIIRMRKEVPEVGWGDFEVLPVRDPAVLAMRYDWRNNSVLFVHNLSDDPARDRLLHRPRGAGRPAAGEPAQREPQPRGGGWPAHPRARAVRVSLVPGRGPRLPAQAQRHRDATARLSPRPWIAGRGGRARSCTRSIRARSRTTTGTASAICEGILRRLPYLRELGVDAVWISPIFPSPMADFGYDVADYVGDRSALRHARGARRASLRGPCERPPDPARPRGEPHLRPARVVPGEPRLARQSARRDWYIWRDPAPGGGPPNNWRSAFGGSAWELDRRTGQYYYHAFLAAQPDLNWRNPAVRAAMHEVMRFWLERGVDGFRVDVIWHLLKDDQFRDNPPNPAFRTGQPPDHAVLPVHTTDLPEVHEVIAGLRRVVDEFPERVLIGEIYLPIERLVTYYGRNLEGAHLPFNFQLLDAPWEARGIARLIDEYEAALPPGGWPNWVLGNHD